MLRDMRPGLRLLVGVLLVGFVLNFGWEMAQMPAYTDPTGQPFRMDLGSTALHCLVPTLGDITVIGLTFALGWAIHSRPDWIRSMSRRDVLSVSLALIVLAIAVELVSVYVLHRWSYSDLMPIIPLLQVGLLPTVQLALLTLLSFRVVAHITQWSRHRS